MTERSRWIALLLMTRLLAAGTAIAILLAHRVTEHDEALIIAVIAYTIVSCLAFHFVQRLPTSPIAWLVDVAAVLALVVASEDWRSPFYVYTLTALILPAVGSPFRRALMWGLGFAFAYFLVALYTELTSFTLQSTVRLETITTHLLVPIVVTLALGYASDVLKRLREERVRTERLAVQAERQRIAWELHDSAKQRVHAAHLMVSALKGQVGADQAGMVETALHELRSATADMDTSVAELRMPLDGRPLEQMLRERAEELAGVSQASIDVHGDLGVELHPLIAAHSYRIAAEALTNAVRHGRAEHIDVALAHGDEGASIMVSDDGSGMPDVLRPGSNGLRSMQSRAETIGARLQIGPGAEGRGTRVLLELPDSNGKETDR